MARRNSALFTTLIFIALGYTARADLPPPAPVCAAESLARTPSYDLGLSLELLLPNRLADFPTTLPAYGLLIGAPIFGHSLQAQGLYGAANGLSLYIFELAYRYEIEVPFFTAFVLAGGHFLHTSYLSTAHDYLGALLGFGLLIPMGKTFELTLAMKVYLPKQSIVSIGGGFTFRL